MIEDAGGALDRPRKASADSETPLLISNLVIEGILENVEAQEEPASAYSIVHRLAGPEVIREVFEMIEM